MAEANLMADLVGPFYDTDGVVELLGVGFDALPTVRTDGRLLGVQTSTGAWLYPSFQFTGHRVEPALLPLLQVFRHAPPWSTAVWLCGPDEYLDGLTPVEWVRAGHPSDVVIRIARYAAHQWAA